MVQFISESIKLCHDFSVRRGPVFDCLIIQILFPLKLFFNSFLLILIEYHYILTYYNSFKMFLMAITGLCFWLLLGPCPYYILFAYHLVWSILVVYKWKIKLLCKNTLWSVMTKDSWKVRVGCSRQYWRSLWCLKMFFYSFFIFI